MQVGSSIRTTSAWQDDKEKVMEEVLLAKADYCQEYTNKLHSIPPTCQISENTLHRFWGGKVGENKLGKLHEKVRSATASLNQERSQHTHQTTQEHAPGHNHHQHDRRQHHRNRTFSPQQSHRHQAEN